MHEGSAAGRLDAQVEGEQGGCHCEDAVTECLGATLVHFVILPDQSDRAPEITRPPVRPTVALRCSPAAMSKKVREPRTRAIRPPSHIGVFTAVMLVSVGQSCSCSHVS